MTRKTIKGYASNANRAQIERAGTEDHVRKEDSLLDKRYSLKIVTQPQRKRASL